MLLLVTTGHPDMVRYRHPNLGRLIQPRHTSSIATTSSAGIPWAADNDCYQQLDAAAYKAMLRKIDGLAGCLFVVVPDVVADHQATLKRWRRWRGAIDQPAAFVLQDGCDAIPDDAQAVFVGGSTLFKMSREAALLVAEARARGLWAHMGRVNSLRRVTYAASIGCQSVDGSSWAMFKRRWLAQGLSYVATPPQLALTTEPEGSGTA